jgi:SAM-dependent methyltransferase
MRKIFVLALAIVATGFASSTPSAQSQAVLRDPDVIYVPTPQSVVDAMLKLAKVTKDDIVYDLGSGDGRIVITAAKQYGARGVGFDIDPKRITESNTNAVAAGVTNLVKFSNADIFADSTTFSDATVVTLYLLPSLNMRLRPKLLSQLKPGSRIVSNNYDMGDWKAEQEQEVDGRTIYMWTVPKR